MEEGWVSMRLRACLALDTSYRVTTLAGEREEGWYRLKLRQSERTEKILCQKPSLRGQTSCKIHGEGLEKILVFLNGECCLLDLKRRALGQKVRVENPKE